MNKKLSNLNKHWPPDLTGAYLKNADLSGAEIHRGGAISKLKKKKNHES